MTTDSTGTEPTLGEVVRNQERLDRRIDELFREVRTMVATTETVRALDRRMTAQEDRSINASQVSGLTVRQVFLAMGTIFASAAMSTITALLVGR